MGAFLGIEPNTMTEMASSMFLARSYSSPSIMKVSERGSLSDLQSRKPRHHSRLQRSRLARIASLTMSVCLLIRRLSASIRATVIGS